MSRVTRGEGGRDFRYWSKSSPGELKALMRQRIVEVQGPAIAERLGSPGRQSAPPQRGSPPASHSGWGGSPERRVRSGRAAGVPPGAGPGPQQQRPGSGYSIKYFGVAHGQLGVLTRRKVVARPAGARPATSAEPSRQAASGAQHAGAPVSPRRPATAHVNASGQMRASERTWRDDARPPSAAPRSRVASARNNTPSLQVNGRTATPVRTPFPQDRSSLAAEYVNPLVISNVWLTPPPDPDQPRVPQGELEPPLPGGGLDGDEGGEEGELQPADENLVDVAEDALGEIWVPSNAVFGRGLRAAPRREVAYSGSAMPGYRARLRSAEPLPDPVPYISHNCLAGWKLSQSVARSR